MLIAGYMPLGWFTDPAYPPFQRLMMHVISTCHREGVEPAGTLMGGTLVSRFDDPDVGIWELRPT